MLSGRNRVHADALSSLESSVFGCGPTHTSVQTEKDGEPQRDRGVVTVVVVVLVVVVVVLVVVVVVGMVMVVVVVL